MIRITQQDSAKDAKRYYATADYYSEGQELVGSWGGKGASRLGLEGTVDKFSFERLCDNLDPRTGEPLTVRTRSERTVGYDFTFSVPKSVSLLYAMSGDKDILDAFRGAVDDTMQEIETEMKTRVRMDGKDEDRRTGNMVWAEFIHTTSRPVGRPPQTRSWTPCKKPSGLDPFIALRLAVFEIADQQRKLLDVAITPTGRFRLLSLRRFQSGPTKFGRRGEGIGRGGDGNIPKLVSRVGGVVPTGRRGAVPVGGLEAPLVNSSPQKNQQEHCWYSVPVEALDSAAAAGRKLLILDCTILQWHRSADQRCLSNKYMRSSTICISRFLLGSRKSMHLRRTVKDKATSEMLASRRAPPLNAAHILSRSLC